MGPVPVHRTNLEPKVVPRMLGPAIDILALTTQLADQDSG